MNFELSVTRNEGINQASSLIYEINGYVVKNVKSYKQFLRFLRFFFIFHLNNKFYLHGLDDQVEFNDSNCNNNE